ncbi:hypothetical protein GCM10027258_66170 [Amycolatopsis stemonae]
MIHAVSGIPGPGSRGQQVHQATGGAAMTENDKREDPEAELARSRRYIEEAKDAAAAADIVDPAAEGPETDQGDSAPSGTP